MPMWRWYGHPDYRYRDEQGRYAAQKGLWEWADQSIEDTQQSVKPWGLMLEQKTLSLADWEQQMRDTIAKEVLRQYILAIGGRDRMTQADYGAVGGIVADQFRYLTEFADRIAAGEYSGAQIAAISTMYIESAREGFERGSARVRGLPDMPAYPGDGSSCLGLTRCGCHWEYHFRQGRWECFWTMNMSKENCDLCIDHSVEWGPLVIER